MKRITIKYLKGDEASVKIKKKSEDIEIEIKDINEENDMMKITSTFINSIANIYNIPMSNVIPTNDGLNIFVNDDGEWIKFMAMTLTEYVTGR